MPETNDTLETEDRPSKLARALKDLGRLIKTLYLLRFINDEAARRTTGRLRSVGDPPDDLD